MTNQQRDNEQLNKTAQAFNNSNVIKQAMILAAGKGTRMRPLTLNTPKPLIDVGGQPLIIWHIKALKHAGITEITINTSWLSDKLITTLGDGSDYGVTIHWSVEKGEPLETAGGVAKALHEGHLKQEPFILINGDVWSDYDLSSLAQYKMEDNQTAHLLLTANPEHNPKGDFGYIDGYASYSDVGVASDTKGSASLKYTFAGISIIAPALVQQISAGEVAALAPILKIQMHYKNVTAGFIDANWFDVGTPERLNQVNAFIKQTKALSHRGRPTN